MITIKKDNLIERVTVKRDRLWVWYPLEDMKFFLFLRSGIETKHKVEFRHSTRNSAESMERSVLLPGYPAKNGYREKLTQKI